MTLFILAHRTENLLTTTVNTTYEFSRSPRSWDIPVTDSNASPPESTDNPPSPPPDDDSERGIGSAWTASGDDLPELEELTPELVEEEAIRGDFMLRGAVILLAVLFGCGQIADSTGLVHIRSGTFMQSNGFLPPRTDVFSIANEDQPTANVSWLFDHLISVIWSLGGAQGLTIFKACIGGLIAWLLTRPGGILYAE